MPDAILDAIEERSARGIAAGIARLVSTGRLEAGTRLPTVRELSRRLGTSPSTVNEAWRHLARRGLIEGRGRSGTFVSGTPRPPHPVRYRQLTEGPGHFALDLSTGTPDPELLPDLGPALARISRTPLTTNYLDRPVLGELEELLLARWPFEPEALTVVDGALDALDRVVAAVVGLGDRVLVEDPGFPPLLDLLEQVGAEPVGVELDEEGVRPESLRAGLAWSPVALFCQPRAQNPTGVSMTAERAATLAAVLAEHGPDVWVVEDDHAGDIAWAPPVSLGGRLPRRCVHIRGFSKSHGPDLRLAAVGGPAALLDVVVDRRLLGPGWSSRLLQQVLAEMLRDEAVVAQVARARRRYAERRRLVAGHLRDRGVASTGSDGINLWVAARREHAALLHLAAHGIGATPGSPFLIGSNDGDHVRVTVGLVRRGHEELADRLAAACLSPPRRGADVRRPGPAR